MHKAYFIVLQFIQCIHSSCEQNQSTAEILMNSFVNKIIQFLRERPPYKLHCTETNISLCIIFQRESQ
jgi:hypothetical protein